MIYIIGMGLHSYEDLSLKSIKILRDADTIYFENYTSIQQESITELEKYINKSIIVCDRNTVESEDIFFENAKDKNIVILVAGTPMFATTHIGLLIRGKQLSVPVQIIHNASILNIYGCLGLYSYHHGKTVSIPFFTDEWRPQSFLKNIIKNIEAGLHTLCLLDIKVEESRYMSVNVALKQILELKNDILNEDYKVFAICRFGSPSEQIEYGKIKDLINIDFDKPLHSLLVPGQMDTLETELVNALWTEKK